MFLFLISPWVTFVTVGSLVPGSFSFCCVEAVSLAAGLTELLPFPSALLSLTFTLLLTQLTIFSGINQKHAINTDELRNRDSREDLRLCYFGLAGRAQIFEIQGGEWSPFLP